MKDNQNQETIVARQLWSGLVHGEQLSADEQSTLQKALENDARLRQECDADATVHALLRSLHDVKQTEDDFVQAVMSTVADGTSLPTVAAAPVATRLPATRAATPRRRASRGGILISLTVVLLAAIGIIVRYAPHPRQAGNPSLQVNVPVIPPAPVLQAPVDQIAVQPVQVPVDHPAAMESLQPAEPAAGAAPLPGSTFVTLTKIEAPVWERSWAEGDRIGDVVVRLFGGRLELTFDDGAKVLVEAPSEFRPLTTGQLQLRRGRMTASVPEEAIGFTVSTPTSQVVDLGTEFEVSVKETGASDVLVRKGEIEVLPAVGKDATPRKWRLVPNGFHKATFFERVNAAETSPVCVAIRGTNGEFQGLISVNGEAAEFASADAFEDVRERVQQRFETSQQETVQQWTEFVEAIRKNVRGTMQLNGAEVQFGNFEEVMKLQQQMLERMRIPGGAPVDVPGADFNGSININGKVISFRTREEYESARRAAFGAAANFGAGDFFDRRNSPRGNNTERQRP